MHRHQLRMWTLAMAVGLGVTTWGADVQAADDEGRYAIRGAGAQSCTGFIQAVEQDENVSIYLRWMEGYISAANLHSDNTFETSPFVSTADTANVLLNVCQANGELKLETALAQLLNTLRPIRLTGDSEVVELQAGDRQLKLRRETLMVVQRALRKSGFYRSSIDGLYGPGTRRAIEAYQKQAEIDITGLPDVKTLLTLTLE